MQDSDKAQGQLIKELAELRRRITELEKSEAECEQMEEALRQGYERYRVLAEATFEGIFLSEEGRFLEMNDQYALMLGYVESPEKTLIVSPDNASRKIDRVCLRISEKDAKASSKTGQS